MHESMLFHSVAVRARGGGAPAPSMDEPPLGMTQQIATPHLCTLYSFIMSFKISFLAYAFTWNSFHRLAINRAYDSAEKKHEKKFNQ